MDFDLAEKLAIVKVIDSVVMADGVVHKGEVSAVTELMNVIGFDSNLILEAHKITEDQGLTILKKMPLDKKEALAKILEDVAKSDGFVHRKEKELMLQIFASIHIGSTID
ncbi:TerB family tellurite resistance protein [Maribacter sp. 2210JD10-5]|uniref:TerB family tellurite resistance protein n=1 Tax=Maribacter sp. 2210JD10-5 TaxID=3386272 RepID=UPI0039BD7764